GQAEALDEVRGEVLVPVREEPRGAPEHVLHPEVVGVALALLDEAHVVEHACVLDGRLSEHLDRAAGGELLTGEQLHERRLTGAVTTEQAVDAVLLEREARVGDGVHGIRAVTVALAETLGARDDAHRASSSIIPASCAGEMRSLCASAMRGAMNCSRNRLRRWATRRARAPSATNMPMPLLLQRIPCSTSSPTPLPVVAGLMRRKAANSLVEGTWVSSGSRPSTMSSSSCSAIWRKIGRLSSTWAPGVDGFIT